MIKRNRKETDRKKYIWTAMGREMTEVVWVFLMVEICEKERKKDRDEEEREKEK
jgi:hypothetical protein